MTPAACQEACGGYKYAGVEYSGECYCGDSLLNNHGPKTDGCTMTCNGDTTQICGGANRINIYEFGSVAPAAPSWVAQGCYVDSVAARSLTHQQFGISGMTNEKCQQSC